MVTRGVSPSDAAGLEDLDARIDATWRLIQNGLIGEARVSAEAMVRRVNQNSNVGDPALLNKLPYLYHVAAHSTSLNVRTEEVEQAILYYKQMEYFSRITENVQLINTSLSYLGDMYRRKGDISRALSYLESAQGIPQVGATALRNNMQLLARSYLRAGRIQEFDSAIKRSEELAHELTQTDTSSQYHLTHVYEEYAKSYVALGKTQTALDYIDLAERHSPHTKSVDILLKVARAEALIFSGDVRNGEPLAVEAAVYTRTHHHLRRLERIYLMKRYIDQKIIQLGKMEHALSEALEGPLEQ